QNQYALRCSQSTLSKRWQSNYQTLTGKIWCSPRGLLMQVQFQWVGTQQCRVFKPRIDCGYSTPYREDAISPDCFCPRPCSPRQRDSCLQLSLGWNDHNAFIGSHQKCIYRMAGLGTQEPVAGKIRMTLPSLEETMPEGSGSLESE
ncbi:MAG: hypothetical protein WC657_08505, partial [Candidatus Paceibacterota bacterium]